MISRKVLIFCLIIGVLMVSIGSASAEDSNETLVSENLNISVDTGSFNDLNMLISENENTITLDRNYTYDSDTDEDYKYGVTVNKDLTIDGNGYTLNGNHESRIFKILDSNVVLKNINFINAVNDDGDGGAIYSDEASLTIINSSFINNHAGDDGGAICSNNDLTIIDSTFIANSANDDGGTIYVYEDYGITITNSIFVNNTGGYWGNVYAGSAEVVNSTFINNHADIAGGALFVIGQIKVDNSNFADNSAEYGGAIRSDKFNITDSYFESNYAECYAVISGTYSEYTEIVNCIFVNNTADNNYLLSCYINSKVENCSFEGNSNIEYLKKTMSIFAYLDDETEYTCFDSIPVEFEVDSDINTTALIYIDGDLYQIINITSSGNYDFALNGLYPGEYQMEIKVPENEFYDAWSNYYSFEVYKIQPGIIVDVENIMYGENLIANISMNYNTSGMVLVSVGSRNYTVSLVNGKSSLIVSDLNPGSYDITVVYQGDAIYESADASASFLVMENGGVYISAKDIVKDEDLIVNINLGGNATGEVLLYVNGTAYPVEIYGSTGKAVISNLSIGTYEIVAIYNNSTDSCIVTVNDYKYTFKDLQELIDNAPSGSTIYLEHNYIFDEAMDYWSVEIFEQITIDGNGHTLDGNNKMQILNTYGNNVVLKNLIFKNGIAEWGGGAIEASGNNLTIINCLFADNVDIYGGGGAIRMTEGDVTIINSTFVRNSGEWVGAIHNQGNNLYVINSSFVNNTPNNINSENIYRAYLTVDLSSNVISEGESITIDVYSSYGATGNVTLVIDENEYVLPLVDYHAQLNVSGLSIGYHTLTAVYSGNDVYKSNTVESIIGVTDENSLIIIANDVEYGKDLIIDVYVGGNATGTVSIIFNGKSYSLALADSHAQLTLSNLEIGEYNITASYTDLTYDTTVTVFDHIYTFTDLQNLINSASPDSTIILEHNYIYDKNTDGDSISIYKDITIDGNGHTLNGNNQVGILYVEESHLVLNNIALINGYSNYGSAIYSDAYSLIIINSSFINNHADDDGGAIYSESYSLMIINSSFINNHADDDGGAIYCNNRLTITDSLFIANSASDDGGTIYMDYSEINLFNSIFINNTGGYWGNLYASSGNVVNSTFINNYVNVDGGAIFVRDNLNVVNSSFVDNTPNNINTENIYDAYLTVDFSSDLISLDDMVTIDVYTSYGATGNVVVTIDETEYTLDLVDYHAQLNVSDLSIGSHEVTTVYSGNDVYKPNTAESIINVISNEILYITAKNIDYGEDLVIDIYVGGNATGTVSVIFEGIEYNLDLIDNHAQLTVPNLEIGNYTISATYGNLTNTTTVNVHEHIYTFKELQELIDNAPSGSTINLEHNYIYDEKIDSGSISASYITINGNGHILNGNNQIRIMDAYNVVLEKIVFVNGNSDNGGAINGYDFTIDHCVFSDNKASNSGGAIYADGFTANKCLFMNNIAGEGGAIHNNWNSFTINNCVFVVNSADQDGSAICNYWAPFSLVNSYFISNMGGGSAVVTIWGDLNVINCTFENNTASDSYSTGAIGAGSSDIFNIVNSSFTGNTLPQISYEKTFEAYLTIDLSSNIVYLGDTVTIDVYTSYGATGNVTVTIDGKEYDLNLIEKTINITPFMEVDENELFFGISNGNGTAHEIYDFYAMIIDDTHYQLNISDLSIGSHTVTATYSGNDIYKPNTAESVINVMGSESLLIISNDVEFGEDLIIDVYVGKNVTGTVIVMFDETEYLVDLIDNHAQLTIPNLKIGNYTISAAYTNITNSTTVRVTGHIYTFKELQELIDEASPGSTIILEHDYVYDSSKDSGSLSIHKDITLDGNGHALDGNNQIRIMNLNSAQLKNIVFINGNSNIGGAIYGDGFTLDNCIFMNNTANDAGAIYGEGFTLDNCKFAYNSANNGAAIQNRWGSLTVANSIFLNNIASTGGNAIEQDQYSLNIINSTFVNNTGGIGTVHSYYADLSVVNCAFINNSGLYEDEGGAITWINEIQPNIENSIFVNNAPRSIYPGLDSNLTVDLSSMVITYGDVLTIDVYTTSGATGNVTVTIDRTDYVLALVDNHAQLNASDLSVGSHRVTAVYPGNDIYGSYYVDYVINVINENIDIIANDIEIGEDLVIYVYVAGNATGTVTIIVNGNEYYVDLIDNKANLIVSGLEIGEYNITATYMNLIATSTAMVNDHKYTFKDLQAIIEAIYWDDIDLGPDNTYYLEHDYVYDSSLDSGSIYIPELYFKLDGNGHTLDGNNQVRILYVDSENTIIFNNITFINGMTDDHGGAIYLNIDNVKIYNCNFINNTANNGGAIYVNDDFRSYSDFLENCSFVGNSANNGGAIYFGGLGYDEIFSIKNSSFINNTAREYGGAIDYGSARSYINSSVFRDNVAGIDGGAIYTIEEIDVENTIFENNRPNNGVNDNATLNVWADDTVYGESLTVTIYSKRDNYVNVSVNQIYYTLELYEDMGTLEINGLNAGNYEITVYGEKETASTNVTVNKAQTHISVSSNFVYVGNSLVLNMSVDNDATGSFIVTVNDDAYDCEIIGGVSSLSVENLPAGIYYISIEYSGDMNYLPSDMILTKYVYKYNANVLIYSPDITYGDNLTINISGPADSSCNIKVLISDYCYDVAILDGMAYIEVPNLNAGEYYIDVIFPGDDKYYAQNATAQATVNMKATYINTTDVTIDFGETLIMNITLSESISDFIMVKIGKTTYNVEIINGAGQLVAGGINAGEYNATLTYIGDDNYIGSQTTASVVIKQIDPQLNVSVDNIIYGDVLVADIQAHPFATGNVTIIIGSKSYETLLIDGKAQAIISDLAAGNYTVTASYGGDNNFISAEAVNPVSVYRKETSIGIETMEITYGEDLTVIVILSEPINENVNIAVDGVNYTVELSNGTGQLIVSDLLAGSHIILAEYAGNQNLTDSRANSSVTVNKLALPIEAIAADITYGEDLSITAILGNQTEMAYRATGNVSAIIDGNVVYKTILVNATATALIEDLMPGIYDIEVLYSGDSNFFNASNTVKITVKKLNSDISVTTSDITYGEDLIINVSSSIETGIVKANINNNEYMINLTNGNGQIVVSNLNAGTYEIIATYLENELYYSSNATAQATVNMKATYINTTDVTIDYGETLIMNITLSESISDFIMVKIGKTTYNVEIINGAGQLVAGGINAGEYNATLTYIGDDNYMGSQTTASVVVKQIDPQLNVSVDNIIYGDVLVADIQAHPFATGNVTVIIGSKSYEILLIDGKAQAIISDLAAGNYTVTTSYGGDNNFITAEALNQVSVYRKETSIGIETMEITYGEDLTVNVVLSEPINENVNIAIDEVDYTVALSNGTGQLTVSDLQAGNHIIHGEYAGNQNLTDSRANSSVTVNKLALPIEAIAADITYGEDLSITAILGNQTEMAYRATGNVSAIIDGNVVYKTELANATATALIEDLMPGIYDIEVLYSGDSNFFNASNTIKVTVKKLNSDISVTTSDITYGEDLIINVSSSIETGIVKANINNNEYMINLTNGNGQIVVSNLNAGTYEIIATYLENELYYSSNATAQATVNKKNSTISVTTSDVIYGEDVVLNIDLIAGATGNLAIYYAGTNKTIPVTAVDCISGLNAGSYDITVNYLGDNNFYPSQAACNVTVTKKTVPMTVSYDDIVYGDSLNVTVAIDVTGNVTINIGNRTLNLAVVDGKVSFAVDGLDAGNYSLSVNYAGDINYFSNNTVSRVHVDKRETIINVEAANITYLDNYNLTLNINATGNVSVSIDNVTYIVEVVNNYAVVPVPVLNAGTYKVIVNYLGSVNYYSNDTITYIYVDKKKTIINVEAESITYGDDINITYNIEASGNVSISMNNVTYIVRIINNQAVLPVGVLNAGNYTVIINYYGDINYYSNNNITYIYVDKSVTTINVKADNIVYGDRKNMVINVNATGNVSAKINDVVYVYEIVNNQVFVPVDMLNAGNYTVQIDYMGDMNHYSNNTVYQLYIDKQNTTINVKCDDIIFGDNLNITLNINATGNVNITIDNVTYTSKVVNNQTTFSIGTLNAGNYSVYIEYLGDTNYYSNNTIYNVTVNKRNTVININCDDIIFGDRLNLTVNVDAVGDVAVEIANITYYATVENNKASLSIGNINAGNYTARITYLGDRNYYSNETYYNVFVDKRNTTINVNCGDIVYGQTLDVTLNIKAEGKVNISIANKTYQAEIVNNTVELFIGNLTAGDYTMVINYYESANYYSSNITYNVKVDKMQSDLNISYENNVFGKDLIVDVNVGDGATGNITLIIDDESYDLALIDGKAQTTVSGLSSGNYTVTASYAGDRNYMSGQNTATITIEKADPELNITALNITYGEDMVVDIQANVLATGNVTVTIGNKTYVVELIEGASKLTLADLAGGDYSISASYDGDANFNNAENITEATVERRNTTIQLIGEDVSYGEDLTIDIIFSEPINDYITVIFNGVIHIIESANGTAQITFSNLSGGKYSIVASFGGNENITGCISNTYATVNTIDPELTVSYDESIIFGEDLVVDIQANTLATGNITATAGNETYTVTLNNGTAQIILSNLTTGTETFIISYSGDVNFTSSEISNTIKVYKNTMFINVTADDIDYGETLIVSVIVPDDLSRRPIVTIDGESKFVTIRNGTGSVKFTGLDVGTHLIEILHAGDPNYRRYAVNTTVDVNKAVPTFKVIANAVAYGDDLVVDIQVPDGLLRRPIVTVDGESKYVTITNGTGSVKFSGLTAGTYDIELSYNGDVHYLKTSVNTTARVNKAIPQIKVISNNIAYGEELVVDIQLPFDVTRRALVTVDNESKYIALSDGIGTVKFSDLSVGIHNIEVSYFGDANYLKASFNKTVKVNRAAPELTITSSNVKDELTINIQMPSDITRRVIVTIGNVTKIVSFTDGIATAKFTGLSPGIYNVEIIHEGDVNYLRTSMNKTIKINKYEPEIQVTAKSVRYGDNLIVDIQMPNDISRRVIVTIGNQTKMVSLNDGVASVSFAGLAVGTYDLEVSYAGDSNYQKTSVNKTVKVSKGIPEISVKANDIVVGETLNVDVQLPADVTRRASVTVGNITKMVSLNNGKANVNFKGLAEGSYDLIVSYAGDENYKASEVKTVIEVN